MKGNEQVLMPQTAGVQGETWEKQDDLQCRTLKRLENWRYRIFETLGKKKSVVWKSSYKPVWATPPLSPSPSQISNSNRTSSRWLYSLEPVEKQAFRLRGEQAQLMSAEGMVWKWKSMAWKFWGRTTLKSGCRIKYFMALTELFTGNYRRMQTTERKKYCQRQGMWSRKQGS